MKKIIKYSTIAAFLFAGLAAFSSQFVESKDLESINFVIGKDFKKINKENYEEINQVVKFNKKENKKIKLDSISLDVKIGLSKTEDIEINFKSYKLKNQEFDLSKYIFSKDGVLVINTIEDSEANSPMGLIQFSKKNVEYKELTSLEILLPQGIDQLILNSVSGEVEIKNLQFMDLLIDSVSGDVQLENVSANKLAINTVSADVNLSKIHFENLKMDTVSGDATVKLAEMKQYDIDFTSISGDITGKNMFHQEKASQKMSVNTISGDFQIQLTE